MSDFVKVGTVDRFRDGRGRTVTVDGVLVAVFRQGKRFLALADRCPHMGASLGQGRVSGGKVICSWHGWDFDLESGLCSKKAGVAVSCYEVRIEGREGAEDRHEELYSVVDGIVVVTKNAVIPDGTEITA